MVMMGLALLPFIVLSAEGAKEGDDSFPVSQIPTTHGLNEGFSRLPHHPVYSKEQRVLLLEGLIATHKRKPEGNNVCFVIVKVQLSEDGKRLHSENWVVQEGMSGFVHQKGMTMETDIPYIFILHEGDGETQILFFEMDKEQDLVRLTRTRYDKKDRIIDYELIFPKYFMADSYTKKGKRNNTFIGDFLLPGWSVFCF